MTVSVDDKAPRVTVLMPVYNGARYLGESLGSILGQTFADFELLVIDDGSTDESAAIVSACTDPRIRLVRQATNQGLIAALNLGLEMSRGEFVARMDADDISHPERLAKQVAFMDKNPRVGVCGTRLEAFSCTSRAEWSPPLTHEEICSNLLFESVIYHPTVIIRKEVLDRHALRYASEYPHAEDYELWVRCSRICRFANIDEVLLFYRLHDESIGSREKTAQIVSANRVRAGLLADLGIVADAGDPAIHEALALWRISADSAFLDRAHSWLLGLLEANHQHEIFPEPAFSGVLARRWYYTCDQAATLGLIAYRAWKNSPLERFHPPVPWRHRLLFLSRCLFQGKKFTQGTPIGQ